MTSPFTPATFTNPIVTPQATTLTRRIPYIGPSEFKAAPTALDVSNLVPGGNAAANTAELYNVLLRASGWVDDECFHGADGTLAASPSIQSGYVTWRSGSSARPSGFRFLCNFRPILSVVGLAMGWNPQELTDVPSSSAQSISIGTNSILFPACAPLFSSMRQYAVWEYVNGYPHMTLASNAAQGATTLQVTSSVPGQAVPYGVYAGTQLTIRDPTGGVEVVVVQSVSGSTLTLTGPLQYTHTVPTAPDFIYITAIPHAIEQATISLASCLIKTRGSGAMVMPAMPGMRPTQTALIQSGGLEDYEIAKRLLKPFTSVFRAS